MAVNSDVATLLANMASLGLPPIHACTVEQAREGFRTRSFGARPGESVVPVAAVEALTVPTGSGAMAARVYRPNTEATDGAVLFFHGGGFVLGDLDTHDNIARAICRATGTTVVSVEYRLAPEFPYPAAVVDATDAADWLVRNLGSFAGDGRLAVAGDSAGGYLAALVAQHLSVRAPGTVVAQLLIYPSIDPMGDYFSHQENGKGYGIEAETLAWFTSHFLPDAESRNDTRLSLLSGDLTALPAAVIVTAEHDPLRDEGSAYAHALRAAGVPVDYQCAKGLIHGFFDLGHLLPSARPYIEATYSKFGQVIRSGVIVG